MNFLGLSEQLSHLTHLFSKHCDFKKHTRLDLGIFLAVLTCCPNSSLSSFGLMVFLDHNLGGHDGLVVSTIASHVHGRLFKSPLVRTPCMFPPCLSGFLSHSKDILYTFPNGP